MKRGMVLLMASVACAFGQQPAERADVLAPLRFLVGTWRGEQAGEPGKGISERTYALVLGGRVTKR